MRVWWVSVPYHQALHSGGLVRQGTSCLQLVAHLPESVLQPAVSRREVNLSSV